MAQLVVLVETSINPLDGGPEGAAERGESEVLLGGRNLLSLVVCVSSLSSHLVNSPRQLSADNFGE